jgi:thiamine-monophosphate kinase
MGLLLGRNRAASACIDLSDGLADGVHHLADRSGVGAIIDADALPIEPSARTWFEAHTGDPTTAAITGGDDYELLFTVRPRTRGRLKAAARSGGTSLTRIGICTADRAVILRCAAGDRPVPPGYSHFR